MIRFMLALGRTFGKVVSFVGFSMSYCLPSLVFSSVVGGNGRSTVLLFVKEYDVAGSSLLDIKEVIKLLSVDLEVEIRVFYTHIGSRSDVETIWGVVNITPSVVRISVSGRDSQAVIDRVAMMSGLAVLSASERAVVTNFKSTAQNYIWKELP